MLFGKVAEIWFAVAVFSKASKLGFSMPVATQIMWLQFSLIWFDFRTFFQTSFHQFLANWLQTIIYGLASKMKQWHCFQILLLTRCGRSWPWQMFFSCVLLQTILHGCKVMRMEGKGALCQTTHTCRPHWISVGFRGQSKEIHIHSHQLMF